MNIKCSKPTITDYDFLRLFISSIILNGASPIIENHQLEKNLFAFYSRLEYHPLFEDICKKDGITGKNNYVDLSHAFQTAYAFGLILQLHDSYSSIRSIVSLSTNEERKSKLNMILKQSSQSIIYVMSYLAKQKQNQEIY